MRGALAAGLLAGRVPQPARSAQRQAQPLPLAMAELAQKAALSAAIAARVRQCLSHTGFGTAATQPPGTSCHSGEDASESSRPRFHHRGRSWCAPLCAGASALQRPGAAKPQPSRFRPWLGFARPLNPASHMALHRPAAEPDVHQRQPGTDACQRRLDQAPRGYWPGCRPSAHRRTDALKRGEGC